MSRSGTSAVVEAFALSGFAAAADGDLMPAGPHNPRGHWERTSVWLANERILADLGGTWLDPPAALAQLAQRERLTPQLRVLVQDLLLAAGPAPVALKDPRIGALLPLWGEIVEDLFHPVLVVREPLAVAASLAARDGTPLVFGLAGWEVHMIALLNHLKGREVTVARYDELVEHPDEASALVGAATLHVDPERRAAVDPAAAPAAFDATLRHHRDPAAGLGADGLTACQGRVWGTLAALPSGTQRLELPGLPAHATAVAHDAVRAETARVAAQRAVLGQAARIQELASAPVPPSDRSP
jgi:hypothetical protein